MTSLRNTIAIMRLNLRLARAARSAGGGGETGAGAASAAGLHLHRDPEAPGDARCHSPRGRLVEIEPGPAGEGRFLALHLALPLPHLDGTDRLTLALRGATDRPMTIRPCLRSGLAKGGFHDSFFPTGLWLGPVAADRMAVLFIAQDAGLPPRARWRELVLFLPAGAAAGAVPGGTSRLSIHDLRVMLT